MGRHVIFLILYIYKIEIRNSKIYLPEVSVSSTMGSGKLDLPVNRYCTLTNTVLDKRPREDSDVP